MSFEKKPELPHHNYPGFSLEEMDAVLSWPKHLIFQKDLPEGKEPSAEVSRPCVWFFDDFLTLVGTAIWYLSLAGQYLS